MLGTVESDPTTIPLLKPQIRPTAFTELNLYRIEPPALAVAVSPYGWLMTHYGWLAG